MTDQARTTTTPGEAFAVTAICFGLPILGSVQAVASGFPSNGFSDAGLVSLVTTELVLAVAALTYLHMRGYAVTSLYPAITVQGFLVGTGLFLGAWMLGWIVTLPFTVGQPDQPIDHMVQDAKVSLPVVVSMAMINGTYEEVFLLGFLLRGLRQFGFSLMVGVPLLIGVLYHLYQGPLGTMWILGFGLLFSLYYVRSAQLWPPIFAHVLWDIVPFVYTRRASARAVTHCPALRSAACAPPAYSADNPLGKNEPSSLFDTVPYAFCFRADAQMICRVANVETFAN